MPKVCEKCGKVITREGVEYQFTLCANEGLHPCKLTTKMTSKIFDKIEDTVLPISKVKQEIIPPGISPEQWDKKKKKKTLKKKLDTITDSKPKNKDNNINWEIKKEVNNQVTKEISKIQDRVSSEIRKLQDELLRAKQEYYKQASKIFESPKFWEGFNRQIVKWLDETIDRKIRNADYHRLVEESIRSKLKENLRYVIREIVESVMKTIDKKFTNEYNNARILCSTIDAEVRHAVQRAPIRATESNIIYKKINRLLDANLKNIEIKKLEDKNEKD